MSLAIAAAAGLARAQTQIPGTVTIYPPTGDYATNVMVASLAAAVNRNTNGELLISANAPNQPNARFWLDRLKEQYPTVQSQVQTNSTVLLNQFRSHVTGYVLYDPANLQSVNVASSIAGIKNAIVIPANQEFSYQLQGFTKQGDGRNTTYQQAYDAFPGQFNKDMLFHQGTSFSYQLRDYAIMNRGFVYYSSPTNLAPFAAQQNPQGRIFGWADSEFDVFNQASQARQQVVASNHNQSSSTTSKWKVPIIGQKHHVSGSVQTKPNKHYIAFVMSDGDNATILTNEFGTHPSWFGNPNRGKFNMNWDFTPSLQDMNPVAHNWWYQQAADGSQGGRDTFVTAHGLGTTYPSAYPLADMPGLVANMSDAMERADHKVISILDNTYTTSRLYPIVDDPQVMGMMYKTNSAAYKGRNGALEFRNGKPILSVKYSLWDKRVETSPGVWVNHPDGASPQDIINALSANTNRDGIDNSASYSIINVHPWSKQFTNGFIDEVNGTSGNVMDNVYHIVSSLDPNQYEIVDLEEMMIHLRNHFGTAVEGALINATWKSNDTGVLSWMTRTNWSGAIPNFIDATATLGIAITGNRAITLAVPAKVGTLNFDNPSAQYTINGGGTLTLDVTSGNAAVNVTRGTHFIDNPLAMADNTTMDIAANSTLDVKTLAAATVNLSKAGAGTLIVNNVRAGALDVTGGTLKIRSSGTTAGTSKVTSVAFGAGGAKIDLTNNKMIVTSATYAAIEALAAAAKLMSSNATTPYTTIAVAPNADLHKVAFGGQLVGDNDILIGYTHTGDANLTGTIDGDDYFQIDAGFAAGGSLAGHYHGDFNRDGSINADDYFLIDTNYARHAGTFPTGAGAGISAVPEPSAFACAFAAALISMTRRRAFFR